MIKDKLLTFADSVAAGNTGTRVVGDVVDTKGLGTATNAGLNSSLGSQRDVGAGEDLYLHVSVDEAFLFSGTTDHSYVVQFVTGDDSNLSDAVVLLASTDPATTDIAIGTVLLQAQLPLEGTAYKRYIGIREVVTGTTTTGKINADIDLEQNTPFKHYAQADVNL